MLISEEMHRNKAAAITHSAIRKTQYFDSVLCKQDAHRITYGRHEPSLTIRSARFRATLSVLVTWRDAFVPEPQFCEIGKSEATFTFPTFPCKLFPSAADKFNKISNKMRKSNASSNLKFHVGRT